MHSAAVKELSKSASFSARKNPHRISWITLPIFLSLRPRIYAAALSPRYGGLPGQTPKTLALAWRLGRSRSDREQ